MVSYTRLGLIATLGLAAFALAPNAAATECVQEGNTTVCVIEEQDFGGDCQQFGFQTYCNSFSSEQLGVSASTDAGTVALFRSETGNENTYDYNDGCASNEQEYENHADVVILDADLTAVGANVDATAGRVGASGNGDYADCGGYSSGSEGSYDAVVAFANVNTADAGASAGAVLQEQSGSGWWEDANGNGSSYSYCDTYQSAGSALFTNGPLGDVYQNVQRNAPC